MNKNVYFKTWVEQNLSRKEEIAAIQAYKALGFSNRAIAAKMNRSPKVINNLIKLGNSYGKNRITGAKPKIDCRTKRQIFKRAVVKHQTASQITADLQLPVTVRRVRQILQNNTLCLSGEKESRN